MANIVTSSLQCNPAADNFEQLQLVLLDISTNFNLAAGNVFQLSLNFSDQFQGYPSLAASIARGSTVQGDPRGAPVLLSKGTVIDGSLATKQALFTVPTGFNCIITNVILRQPSVSLATLSISFGFDASAANVIANATHTGLTAATEAKNLVPIATDYVFGTTGQVFGVIANTQQASNVTIDVIGYLF